VKTYTFKGIPTLRILDYEKAVEFYIHFLGFNIDWEHRFSSSEPVYMQISLNNLMLHLSENQRFQPNNIVFVETEGIQNFRADLSSKDTNFPVPEVSKTPWHTFQMEIEDPFGNLLRFNENISET